MNRREIGAALAAASLLTLVASAGGALAAASQLTIGVLPELTGPLSDSGPDFEKASRLAVEVANKAAKAAGTQMTVKVAIADPQGDPQAALSAARVVVDKGASCILGPSTTPELIAILNGLTMQRKITMWPTRFKHAPAHGQGRRHDLSHRSARLAADQGADGGHHRRDRKPSGKTLAIAYRNEPYGEGIAKGVAQAWRAAGGKVQGPIGFDPQQASFDSEAGQLVAGTPDAYLVDRLSRDLREVRRGPGPHGQVRRQEAFRARRHVHVDGAGQHPAGRSRRGARRDHRGAEGVEGVQCLRQALGRPRRDSERGVHDQRLRRRA